MSFMSTRRWAIKETFRGLCNDKGVFSLAIVLSALALSIPVFISSIAYSLAEPIRSLPTAVEITVFTESGAKLSNLETQIAELPNVARVATLNRKDAFEALKNQLGIQKKKALTNPLPDILIVSMAKFADKAAIKETADQIEHLSGVDMTAFDDSWHEKLDALTRTAYAVILAIGVVVFALVVLVLAAAIKMSTASARPLMHALHLFGASPSFAIRPWAWRGFLLMAVSAGLALLINALSLKFISYPLAQIADLYGTALYVRLPQASWCFGFILSCSLIGGIVTALVAKNIWRHAQCYR